MLEAQIMAIEVSGAAVSLVRWQRGADIYREEDGTEGAAESGYEIVIDHARLDPDQALTFAHAVRSVANRAVYLRSLDKR